VPVALLGGLRRSTLVWFELERQRVLLLRRLERDRVMVLLSASRLRREMGEQCADNSADDTWYAEVRRVSTVVASMVSPAYAA
jgi:hypothetical protein